MSGLGRNQRLVLTGLVLLLALWLLRSFLLALTWAATLALATWPLYRRFAARLSRPLGPTATAFLFTLLVALLVLGPFGFAFLAIAHQAESWAQQLVVAGERGLPAPVWLAGVPLAGSWLVERWNTVLGTPGGLSRWLHGADGASLLAYAQSTGGFVIHHAMLILFTVLAQFFLYRSGEPLAERVKGYVHARLGERGDVYFRRVTKSVRASVSAMIVVSVIDGVLCGVAFALAGVPSAHVWGAITGLLAMIPFLAYFGVGGAALFLLAKGMQTAATVVFLWGVIVIFVTDKVVRAEIVGSATRLGFFWVLVGGLGGLETFGLLGVLLGPVILELAGALLREASAEP